MNTVRTLLALAGARRTGWLLALMVASAISEGIGLVLLVPLLAVLTPGTTPPAKLAALLNAAGIPLALEPLLGLFVMLVAARAVLTRARALATATCLFDVVDNLRGRAWDALLHCDWRTLVQLRRSDSASLLLSEVERAGHAVQQLLVTLATAITLGGILLGALAVSPWLTLGAALAGLLLFALQAGLRRRAALLGGAVGTAYSALHASLGEGLAALRTIKSVGGEARAAAQTQASMAALRTVQLTFIRSSTHSQALLQLGGASALAVLVWLAVARWQLSAATILPMVALFARALPLLGQLQETTLGWLHARPALDAALALTAAAEAAREPAADAVAPPEFTAALVFEAVSVRFGTAPASLDAVSLSVAARGITAITGASGAGKSTLADLAGGLLAPDAGQVSIDGVPLVGPLRRAWRSQVAYVQQDQVLLAGTVRDNLRWAAPKMSEAELRSALADAAASFALALPDGLDTLIGDGGRGLSGGERQRLMLARALLRRPALLILDEATSALDAENEAQIAAALVRLKARMAVLVIAHRGALAEIADQTYTLANGRLIS